jgi:16S rRNA (adenine1518-N6/adenine1519-N6)-dimethyltransferase
VTLPFPNPKETLLAHGLRPKRSFGQNFLCDAHLVDRIAALCPPTAFVIEIGAGLGGLTVSLLNRGHEVFAIERDRDLIPVLNQRLAEALESKQLQLCEADAKSIDYEEVLGAHRQPRVVSGNLPYNLTGPLLQRATECAASLTRAIFLVQLEVAERLTADAGTEHYGGLSVFAQNAFTVRREFIVRRGAFYPQPQVDSAVVALDPRPVPYSRETAVFRALVNGAFQQRRKTLRNAWSNLPGVSQDLLVTCAARSGIALTARGETLSVQQFANMAHTLEAELGVKD